jgi:hypothetical protein
LKLTGKRISTAQWRAPRGEPSSGRNFWIGNGQVSAGEPCWELSRIWGAWAIMIFPVGYSPAGDDDEVGLAVGGNGGGG